MPHLSPTRFRRPAGRLLAASLAFALPLGAEAQDALNESPRVEPATAQHNGHDLDPSEHGAAPGLGAATPVSGVQLVARSFRGHLFPTAGKKPKMARKGTLHQDDLLPPESGDDGVALAPAHGPLRTAGYFAGFRLHTEWLGTRTGPGLRLPGGLRLPAAPDATPIATPSAPETPRWHAEDLWFQPAQANRPARVTLLRNGTLIHNDIPVGTPGVTEPAPLEFGHPDYTAAIPQRLRNVWVAPLGNPAAVTAGPWHNLLAQAHDAAEIWTICGGTSTFEYNPDTGILLGTAVPNSGGNTFQVTRNTYGDFELQVEVWTDQATDQSKGLNSGIQIRSHVAGGVEQRDGRMSGYQVELDPTPRRYSGGIYDEKRRGWLAPLIAAPYARDAWKPGTWNRILIRAQGPVIRTWVNGVPAANLMDALTARGHIALQVHDVGDRDDRPQVRFRSVMLRELKTAGH